MNSGRNSLQGVLVTIGIPTLNRANYLQIALDSAMAQSYSDLEIVVSNNASTDATAAFLASVKDSRVRVVEQKNTLSMVENFNACLTAASGKYFILLSDDDVLEPTAIEQMLNIFEDSERQGERIGFVYCSGKVIDQDGITQSLGNQAPSLESAEEIIPAFFAGRRSTWPCAILFRKQDLAPGYDLRFPLMGDATQWIRIVVAYGAARFVNQRLTRYRVHANTSSKTPPDIWRRESVAASEFAIDALRKLRGADDDLVRKIRKSVCRLNVVHTTDLINGSLRHHKLKAFREYWKYREEFISIFGVLTLIRGLGLLMLPDFFRAWVRRRLYSRISFDAAVESFPKRLS
jgi:glycosyltransferase involved in cell wall biosynthesis